MKRNVLVSLCACALLFLAGAALAALPTMDAVKAFLPKMDGWTSEDPTGMQGASLVLVEQRFEKNEETNLSLLITMGDDANHAPMFDAYSEQKIDRIETGDGYVAFVKIGNFRAMEQLEKSSKTAALWVDLGNTAWLGATGEGMTVEEVKAVVGRIDLAGLAALAPAAAK
mgnify:CR=1 FL=1|jgi:hypothetical protein